MRTLCFALILSALGAVAVFMAGCSDSDERSMTPMAQNATPAPAPAGGGGDLPKTDTEWKQALTPEQYYVCRQKGTERPFQNAYWNNKKEGMYRCAGCGEDLFSSEAKFDSGSGWPSFWAPARKEGVAEAADGSHFMRRTEVLCRRCGSHLGHLFDDAPQTPTGMRYCINSAALKFAEKKAGEKGQEK